MKFLLFRILLLHRTRDQGFTLPMVIGIGLIMVLLGSMSLVQSSEENLNAISKDQSSTSLAMAELGIARYRELLNNNRVLAVYSLDVTGAPDWTTNNVSNQTCDDITGIGGWADNTDLTGWRDIVLDETVYDVDFNDDNDKADTTAKIGSYRLVDYVYQNDNNPGVGGDFGQISDALNTGNPRGILTVQGKAKDTDSVAQIQVTIPIGVNTEDLNTLDPGIWIHQSEVSAANLGDIEFRDSDGNLTDLGKLVLEKKTSGDDRCTDVAGLVDIREPRDLPPLATLPGSFNTFDGNIDQNTTNEPIWASNELILGKLNATVPPNVDSDDVERYYYQVTGTSLDIDNDQNLLADGTSKVVVIVNGSLDITGNVEIGNTSSDATSNFLEIYVNGNVTIDGNGTVDINGLIRSSGTVSILGNTTVNLKGSIWAEDWDNDGEVNVIRDVGYDDYKYYSTTHQRTPKPLTYAPTGWEQQEAD